MLTAFSKPGGILHKRAKGGIMKLFARTILIFFLILSGAHAARPSPSKSKKKVINIFINGKSKFIDLLNMIALEVKDTQNQYQVNITKGAGVVVPYLYITAPKKIYDKTDFISIHAAINLGDGVSYVRYARVPKNTTETCKIAALKKWVQNLLNPNFAQDPDGMWRINAHPELGCNPNRKFVLTSSLVIAHKGEPKHHYFNSFVDKLKIRMRDHSGSFGAKVETPTKTKVKNETGCKTLSWECEFKYAKQETARRLTLQIGSEGGVFEIRMSKWKLQKPKKSTRDDFIIKIHPTYFTNTTCQRELISTIHNWSISKNTHPPTRPQSCTANRSEFRNNAIKTTGLTAIGVGVAATLAGGIFWIFNANISSDFNEKYRQVKTIQDGKALHQLYDDANNTKNATIGFLVAGGASVAIGIIIVAIINNQNKPQKLPPLPGQILKKGNVTTLLNIQ